MDERSESLYEDEDESTFQEAKKRGIITFLKENAFFQNFYNCCCKKYTYVETNVMMEGGKKFPEDACCGGAMRFLIPLRALFCWMIPILCVGCWKVTLNPIDLPELSDQYKCSHNLKKFKSLWRRTHFLKKTQLPVCLYIIFGFEYLFAAILKIIATCFSVMIPFFLSYFLHEFHPRLSDEEREDFDHYREILPNDLKPPTEMSELGYRENDGKIWLWLLLMVIFQFFGYLFSQNSNYFATRVGGKMRVLLGAAITEKVFTVRSDRIHETNHPKGELLNYFATDAFMVDLAHWFILDLLGAIILVGVAVYFLVDLIGVSAVFVFLVAAIVLTSVTFLTTFVFVFRKQYFKWIDRRITRMRESFYNIKVIKWFQWEDVYRKKILKMRRRELVFLRLIFVCLSLVTALGIVAPPAFTVAGFGHFYMYNGYVDFINLFSASSYFLLLRIPIISFAQNSIMYFTGLVSMLRIQTFLQEPDRESSSKKKMNNAQQGWYKRYEYDKGNSNAIEIENGSFVWSQDHVESFIEYQNNISTIQQQQQEEEIENEEQQQQEEEEEEQPPFCLQDVNFHVPNGQLVMVVGRSGSGKTSFLKSILGEMIPLDPKKSQVYTNGTFAFCQQPPWIQNVSLRENITFFSDADDKDEDEDEKNRREKRFEEVLRVCHLEDDFHKLEKDFARMEIGEAGTTVSSGQQSRISLARACYSSADIFLLDNVLANLDTCVAAQVFEDCVLKYLGDVTRIMVTKKLHLCSSADLILVLEAGKIVEMGSFEGLMGIMDDDDVGGGVFKSLYHEGESEERFRMNTIENILEKLHNRNNKSRKKKVFVEQEQQKEEKTEEEEIVEENIKEEEEEEEEEEGGEETEEEVIGIINEEEIEIEEDNNNYESSSSSISSEEEEEEEDDETPDKSTTVSTTTTTTTRYKITELEERVIGILPIRAVCSYLCFGGCGCCVTTFVLIMYLCSVTWYFIFEYHIGNFAEQLMYHQIYGTEFETQYYYDDDDDNSYTYYKPEDEEYYCVLRGYSCETGVVVDISWDKNYNNGTLLADGLGNTLSLGIYALATIVLFFLVVIESSIFFQCFISRSQRMFRRALGSLFSSPVVVFDRHPVGRIISRLSYDVASLENEALIKFDNVMNTFYVSSLAMLMVCVLTSGVFVLPLAVAVAAYSCIYVGIRKPTMELKRIEAVSRSPLFATFSQTVLEGRESARAFGVEELVMERARRHIDYHNRSYYLVNVAVRTLEEYLNIVSVLLVFSAGACAVIVGYYFPDGFKDAVFTDPFKDLGMGFTFAISLIPEMFPVCASDFVYGETKLNAIERLEYYANKLKKEECIVGEGRKDRIMRLLQERILFSKFEEKRRIIYDDDEDVLDDDSEQQKQPILRFENVGVRYQEHLPFVLNNLSFEVEKNQSIGIVGKTGSGKTSTITRIVPIEEGKIFLNGKDIQSEVKLNRLRKRISVLPAHPVLFEGTIRTNLDPNNTVKDEVLRDVIGKCGGSDLINSHGGLDGHVEDEGGNFSCGEKQIIGLIRCVVKKDADILLIDEYSSTMDDKIVEIVQKTIEKLEGITILSISHNLRRVIQYDRIIVLDEGRILEFDTPKKLLQNEKSLFHQMVSLSPDREELHRIVNLKDV